MRTRLGRRQNFFIFLMYFSSSAGMITPSKQNNRHKPKPKEEPDMKKLFSKLAAAALAASMVIGTATTALSTYAANLNRGGTG